MVGYARANMLPGLLAAWTMLLTAAPRLDAGTGRAIEAEVPAQIEFWTLALAPFSGYLRERISEFERLHPSVRVKWVDVPFEAVDRKLIAAAAARREPDVINLSDRTFGRFAGLGAMADLRPLLDFDPEGVYLDGALAIGRFGDRLLALPWYLTTQIGMVNTALLAAGGIDGGASALATDWTGLRAQGREYHRRSGRWLFSLPLGEESQLPVLMWSEGLRPLTAGFDRGVVSNLTDPAIVEFIREWVAYYRSGAMPPEAATRDHSHLTEMFQNRELALIDSGPNFLRRVQDVAPSVYATTETRGPVTGASGKSHIATMVVAVMRRSRHAREAAAFAAFITSPESQTEFCRLAPILPSTPESLRSEVFAPPARRDEGSTVNKVALARAVAAASLRDAVAFTPAMEAWPDLRRAFEERMKSLLLDGGDVEQAMRRLDATWNRILRESPAASVEALPRVESIRRPDGSATHNRVGSTPDVAGSRIGAHP